MRLPIAALVLCMALPAGATRVRRMWLDEIRDSATAIVVIDVIDSQSRRGAAGMVWTDYHGRVAEVLRGNGAAGDVVTLSFAGGRAGGIEAGIAGVPRLELGSRYLIFVDDVPGRPVPAIGWSQGIFGVDTSQRLISADGELLAVDARGALVRLRGPRTRTHRAADPLVLNADGTPAARGVIRSDSAAIARPATLKDLRRFVKRPATASQ